MGDAADALAQLAAMEPRITVNGVELTVGQAMTVRVALNSFLINLDCHGLGEDEHGKAMTANYTARGKEVLSYMHQNIRRQREQANPTEA